MATIYYYYNTDKNEIGKSYFKDDTKIRFIEDKFKIIDYARQQDIYYDKNTDKFTFTFVNFIPSDIIHKIYENAMKEYFKLKVIEIQRPIVKFKNVMVMTSKDINNYRHQVRLRHLDGGDVTVEFDEDDYHLDEWEKIEYTKPLDRGVRKDTVVGKINCLRNNSCCATKGNGNPCKNNCSNTMLSLNTKYDLTGLALPMTLAMYSKVSWDYEEKHIIHYVNLPYCRVHYKRDDAEFMNQKFKGFLGSMGYQLKDGYILKN